jgi:hypothetical protein
MYSKQKVFCNCCGKELYIELPRMVGKEFRCCSMECVREMNWRHTLSIMNKEYKLECKPDYNKSTVGA